MKLFIPGPVSVREEILAQMGKPMIGHRGSEASDLQENISKKMQRLWNTKETILLSTSSGSGLMEGAVRSCTRKKAAIFSVGAFGKRWYEMAKNNGVKADLFEVEAGEITEPEKVDEVLKSGDYDVVTITHNETSTGVMNPLQDIAEAVRRYPEVIFCVDTVSSSGGVELNVDELGVDIMITSTQKCLGLPPGMAICSFSQKAVEHSKNVENRGYYLDLLNLYDYIMKKNYQYPSTPSLSHMFALDCQLDYILDVEGKESRFRRHHQMAEAVRHWAGKHFALFAKEGYESDTVTAVKNILNIDVNKLNQSLKQRNMQLSNGYGNWKNRTFRIAHMADTTMEDITTLLQTIDEILEL